MLTQWAIGQFGVYAAMKGWKFDPTQPGLLGVTMLRYQAWCEKHRDTKGPRPSYDVWDLTVDSVDPVGDDAVDPTPGAPSGG
jgi:hypothetical protein